MSVRVVSSVREEVTQQCIRLALSQDLQFQHPREEGGGWSGGRGRWKVGGPGCFYTPLWFCATLTPVPPGMWGCMPANTSTTWGGGH